jgi:hypothetical protein
MRPTTSFRTRACGIGKVLSESIDKACNGRGSQRRPSPSFDFRASERVPFGQRLDLRTRACTCRLEKTEVARCWKRRRSGDTAKQRWRAVFEDIGDTVPRYGSAEIERGGGSNPFVVLSSIQNGFPKGLLVLFHLVLFVKRKHARARHTRALRRDLLDLQVASECRRQFPHDPSARMLGRCA